MNIKIKKIYYCFLIISSLVFTPLLIMNKESYFGILGFNFSLILSYALFNNKRNLTAVSGSMLSAVYAFVYFTDGTFAQMSYEVYSTIIFFSLLFRKNEVSKKFLNYLIEGTIVILFGTITYFLLAHDKLNMIIVLLDFSAFVVILIATMFSGHQSIYQFYFYIPSSILLIALGLLINNYAIVSSSICFIVADSMSLYNWKLMKIKNS